MSALDPHSFCRGVVAKAHQLLVFVGFIVVADQISSMAFLMTAASPAKSASVDTGGLRPKYGRGRPPGTAEPASRLC